MVYLQEKFATEAEADKFIVDYEANYHPAGYGTWCRKKEVDGVWIVDVTRGDSCD